MATKRQLLEIIADLEIEKIALKAMRYKREWDLPKSPPWEEDLLKFAKEYYSNAGSVPQSVVIYGSDYGEIEIIPADPANLDHAIDLLTRRKWNAESRT